MFLNEIYNSTKSIFRKKENATIEEFNYERPKPRISTSDRIEAALSINMRNKTFLVHTKHNTLLVKVRVLVESNLYRAVLMFSDIKVVFSDENLFNLQKKIIDFTNSI